MKKRILALVATVFILLVQVLMSGCSDSNKPNNSSTATSTSVEGSVPGDESSTSADVSSTGSETFGSNGASGTNSTKKGDTKTTAATSSSYSVPKTGVSGRVSDLKGRVIKHNVGENLDTSTESYKRMMRNIKAIEKKYNCTIKLYPMGNEVAGRTQILTSVLAGSPVCDTWMQGNEVFLSRYRANLLQNLSDLQVFGFEDKNAPWPKMMEACKINGSYYAVESPDTAYYTWFSPVLLYNKKLLESYAPKYANSLYSLQQSGNWTWDKFKEVCEAFNKGAASQSSLASCFDRSGLAYEMMVLTKGADWIKKDAKGNLIFNGNDSKAQSALNTYASYVQQNIIRMDGRAVGLGTEWSGNVSGWENKYGFLYNQALFAFTSIGGYYWNVFQYAGTNQAVKDNVGVLLIPKWNASDSYTYSMPMQISGYGIPYGVKNPNEVATILNALYLEEAETLTPTQNRDTFYTEQIEPTINTKTGSQTKATIMQVYDQFAAGNINTFISSYSNYTDPSVWGDANIGWMSKYVFDVAHGSMAQSAALSAVTSKYNSLLSKLTEKR